MLKVNVTNKQFKDILHEIIFHHDERANIFRLQPIPVRAQLFLVLSKHILYDLLSKLNPEEVA
ncbi:hypothetical protein BH09PAT2_BH09PAT2_03760 [soil metagenome]